MTCKKCNKFFKGRCTINGKEHNLASRKYCLECSPFGTHNTKKLDCSPEKRRQFDKTKRAVIGWRKRAKMLLIEYKGGKCIICGYDKPIPPAFAFHHRDSSAKDFCVSGKSLSMCRLKVEADKCDLLCLRCHAEVHYEQDYSKIPFEKIRKYNTPINISCLNCGTIFLGNSDRKFCGPECAHRAARRAERPGKELLQQLIKENNWCSIGRIYNVTDNAVRKWARSYGII